MSRGGRNPSIDRNLPIIRLPSADDQIVRDAERLKRHLNQMEREIETHWHPQQQTSAEDVAVELHIPVISLAGTLASTTRIPTFTATANSVVTHVKIAERIDRYPTLAEVRAQASILTTPYARSFSALAPGQIAFATALGYSDTGAESEPAQATVQADEAPISTANVWAFYRRGVGYYTDVAKTIPAVLNDVIRVWADQSGNGRDATSGVGLAGGGDDNRPELVASDQLSVGHNASGAAGRSGFVVPTTAALNEMEILMSVKADNDPPATGSAGYRRLMQFSSSGSVGTAYPDDTGHIVESVGRTAVGTVDMGDPTDDLTEWTVYDVSASNTTNQLNSYVNNVLLHSEQFVSSPSFNFNGPNLIAVTSLETHAFQGRFKDFVIIQGVLDDASRLAWYEYLSGATDVAPTDSGVVTLSTVQIGGDIEVTATMPLADSVKMAASTSGVPTDADVRAATADTTEPFRQLFPAPEVGETLYIGAFAYIGTTESTRANTTVDGSVSVSTSEGDLILVPGDGVTLDTTTTPGSIIVTSTGAAAQTPTLVASGETFTVLANKQVLFKLPIRVLGDLVVRGDLLQVA